MKKLLCLLFPSATAVIRAEGYQGAIDDLGNLLGLKIVKIVTPRKKRASKSVATDAPITVNTDGDKD